MSNPNKNFRKKIFFDFLFFNHYESYTQVYFIHWETQYLFLMQISQLIKVVKYLFYMHGNILLVSKRTF